MAAPAAMAIREAPGRVEQVMAADEDVEGAQQADVDDRLDQYVQRRRQDVACSAGDNDVEGVELAGRAFHRRTDDGVGADIRRVAGAPWPIAACAFSELRPATDTFAQYSATGERYPG